MIDDLQLSESIKYVKKSPMLEENFLLPHVRLYPKKAYSATNIGPGSLESFARFVITAFLRSLARTKHNCSESPDVYFALDLLLSYRGRELVFVLLSRVYLKLDCALGSLCS